MIAGTVAVGWSIGLGYPHLDRHREDSCPRVVAPRATTCKAPAKRGFSLLCSGSRDEGFCTELGQNSVGEALGAPFAAQWDRGVIALAAARMAAERRRL